MFNSLLELLAQRVPASRAQLLGDCLNQLYYDFHCAGLDEFSTLMVVGADDQYDLHELDVIVASACIELYQQQLLAFGVRLHDGLISLDSLKYLHALAATLLTVERHDDTEALLSIVEDEDLLPHEVLATCAQHIYGIDADSLAPIIAYVHSSLLLKMQQTLSSKLEKETTVDEAIHVPEFIQNRLQVFQGVYTGVFYDYLNTGGAIAVPFELMLSSCSEPLVPVRSMPYEFTQEIILFALASNMANQDVVPTVQSLITVNFPLPEDSKEAQRALNDYLTRYGSSLL